MSDTIILIPSRMSAKRLPGKPLMPINGIPIISHVLKKAQETQIGEVFVATEDEEIRDEIKKNKGNAVLTSKNPLTGTDRIWEAYKLLNLKNIQYIINLQGDEPMINVDDIKNLHMLTKKYHCQINTLASDLHNSELLNNKNVVKVQTDKLLTKNSIAAAKNFFREKYEKSKNIYHHIGVYEFNVSTLKTFTSLKQSQNEKKKNLEQLRALDNNIKIDVSYASNKIIGIDTIEDYIELKNIMEYKK